MVKFWQKDSHAGHLEPLSHGAGSRSHQLGTNRESLADRNSPPPIPSSPDNVDIGTFAEPKGRSRSSWEHTKAWWPEIIWTLLSIAMLIALIVALSQFEGRPAPQWKFGLTLNTLVAFLSTICRSMTVMPIAEGLSQLKWNWIAKHHKPLLDLYTFDQASRGPFGSLALLFTLRGRFVSYGSLASLVMLSGLFTSFLTQSTIAYENIPSMRNTPGSNIETPRAPAARSYPDAILEANGIDSRAVVDGISRAAYQAAFRTVDEPWPTPELKCQTRDCTWSEFTSLAVCASVGNITESLVLSNLTLPNVADIKTMSAQLPDDAAILEVSSESPAVANMTALPPSIPSKRDAWPYPRAFLTDWGNDDLKVATFSQFSFLYNNFGADNAIGLRGVEILWHFCVNTYTAGISNGTSTTNISSSTTRIRHIEPKPSGRPYGAWFELLSEDNGTAFRVSDGLAYTNLDLNFLQAFEGEGGPSRQSQLGFNYQMGLNIFSGTRYNAGEVANNKGPPEGEVEKKMWENIHSIANNIADAMTAYLREADTGGVAEGVAYEQEAHVIVRWEWLSLLLVQVVLTVVFLILVIAHTAFLDMDVVKSSNIAEIFATHVTDGDSDPGTGGDMCGFQAKGVNTVIGKGVRAKLVKRDYGWKMDVR